MRDTPGSAAAEHDADAPAYEQPRDAVVITGAVDANMMVAIHGAMSASQLRVPRGRVVDGACNSTSSVRRETAPRRRANSSSTARVRLVPSAAAGQHDEVRVRHTFFGPRAEVRLGDIDDCVV